ncbi:MAG: flavodoxin family protein [Desulfobacteraceae bacterium]|nr:flavodoxin family protein [Desulfobacteraceae bacterium]
MMLLAIFGSPRKNGNTDLMLESFLDGASDRVDLSVERIYVRDLAISGCLGCGHCDKKGECVQKDDMTKVYPLLDGADRIVFASPVYFYGLPGQAKLLVDRSQASFMRKMIARESRTAPRTDRRGFFLSAGATRGKRLFECSILTMKYFFDALGVGYAGELCYRELDGRNAVQLHPTALEDCRKAGREFAAVSRPPAGLL